MGPTPGDGADGGEGGQEGQEDEGDNRSFYGSDSQVGRSAAGICSGAGSACIYAVEARIAHC